MVDKLSHELKKLATYNNVDYPILSLYFTLPQDIDDMYPMLHRQLHQLANKASAADRLRFRNELEYIDGMFAERKNLPAGRQGFNHGARAIAIFSGGNKLWEVVSLPFPAKLYIKVAHSPFLEPIQHNLALYKRYLVILADRKKARFFTIQGGRVESEESVIDPSVPQNVKANEERYYGRADKISRHIQDHLNQHLKLIADRINHFVKGKTINGVIVGGHDTLIHKTEEYLPTPLKRKVIAEFISELNVNLSQIADNSMKIIDNLNQANQQFSL